jgi:hypothetical protein
LRNIVLYFSGNPRRTLKTVLRYEQALTSGRFFAPLHVISYLHDERSRHETLHVRGGKVPRKVFGNLDVQQLQYPKKIKSRFRLKPGNCDIPVLLFWKENPQYTNYYVAEDDVAYSGELNELFSELDKIPGDLLCTHVHPCYSEWDYAGHFSCGPGVKRLEPKDCLLCFLPFFRVSSRALTAIDQAYCEGWSGHHEMTWPTILRAVDMSVIDIGGSGPFVADKLRNRFYHGYISNGRKYGSFVSSPARLRPGPAPNILWHPVKRLDQWLLAAYKRAKSIGAFYLRKYRKAFA